MATRMAIDMNVQNFGKNMLFYSAKSFTETTFWTLFGWNICSGQIMGQISILIFLMLRHSKKKLKTHPTQHSTHSDVSMLFVLIHGRTQAFVETRLNVTDIPYEFSEFDSHPFSGILRMQYDRIFSIWNWYNSLEVLCFSAHRHDERPFTHCCLMENQWRRHYDEKYRKWVKTYVN